jgi:hypothetical protein
MRTVRYALREAWRKTIRRDIGSRPENPIDEDTRRSINVPRTLTFLSDEDLVRIVEAPPEMTTVDLARRLGRPYNTVAHARRRFQRDGWATTLRYTTCEICSDPIAYACSWKPKAHPQCHRAYENARAQRYRRGPHTPSTKYVYAWQQRNPDRARELYEQEKKRAAEKRHETWTAEQWAPVLERAHEADKRDQEITLELAENSGSAWTPDEDQYVWGHLTTPARDVALELGRTLWAVRGRRVWLRRHPPA